MLIGLCGKPQSGKTEVRKMLEGRFGFEVICSKQILYKMSSMVTGLPESDFYLTSKKNNDFNGYTHRQITGKLGNVIEEMFGDSYLIKRALRDINTNSSTLVLDSLRKDQALDFPGFVVEVVSDRGIDTGNCFDYYNRDRIDWRIKNNGDFEQLEANVSVMLDFINT